MLSQARPRTFTLLRRHVYALSPKNNNQLQRTNGWGLAVPRRIESTRWAHRKSQSAEEVREPAPPATPSISPQYLGCVEVTSDVVATPHQVSDMLQTISHIRPRSDPFLYLNAESPDLSRNGEISVLTILVEPKRHVYIIDVQKLGHEAFTTMGSGISLKQILESTHIPKAFFDVRPDADALFGLYGIRLQEVEDVQLLENACHGRKTRVFLRSLSSCIKADAPVEESQRTAWLETKSECMSLFMGEGGRQFEHFTKRPLPQECKDYSVNQVKWLPLLRSVYIRTLRKNRSGTRWCWRTTVEAKKRVEAAQSPWYIAGIRQVDVRGPWSEIESKKPKTTPNTAPETSQKQYKEQYKKKYKKQPKKQPKKEPKKELKKQPQHLEQFKTDAYKWETEGASTEPAIATAEPATNLIVFASPSTNTNLSG
ncbi:hypothetical protein MCOR25_001560 [Pyricularia grisea]|nr:hypothetical protein MCOR25_001560 [Pyricularia grisea]